jgi:hypothetical protein
MRTGTTELRRGSAATLLKSKLQHKKMPATSTLHPGLRALTARAARKLSYFANSILATVNSILPFTFLTVPVAVTFLVSLQTFW